MANAPRPFIGLAAGIAAGLVAAAAMAAFQAQAPRPIDRDDGGEDEPAPRREAGGSRVRYVAGAVMGGIYGVLAEYRPEARAGFGGAYGAATSALLDEAAVPDLGSDPGETHVDGVASHLIYGVVLEGIRALIAGRR